MVNKKKFKNKFNFQESLRNSYTAGSSFKLHNTKGSTHKHSDNPFFHEHHNKIQYNDRNKKTIRSGYDTIHNFGWYGYSPVSSFELFGILLVYLIITLSFLLTVFLGFYLYYGLCHALSIFIYLLDIFLIVIEEKQASQSFTEYHIELTYRYIDWSTEIHNYVFYEFLFPEIHKIIDPIFANLIKIFYNVWNNYINDYIIYINKILLPVKKTILDFLEPIWVFYKENIRYEYRRLKPHVKRWVWDFYRELSFLTRQEIFLYNNLELYFQYQQRLEVLPLRFLITYTLNERRAYTYNLGYLRHILYIYRPVMDMEDPNAADWNGLEVERQIFQYYHNRISKYYYKYIWPQIRPSWWTHVEYYWAKLNVWWAPYWVQIKYYWAELNKWWTPYWVQIKYYWAKVVYCWDKFKSTLDQMKHSIIDPLKNRWTKFKEWYISIDDFLRDCFYYGWDLLIKLLNTTFADLKELQNEIFVKLKNFLNELFKKLREFVLS